MIGILRTILLVMLVGQVTQFAEARQQVPPGPGDDPWGCPKYSNCPDGPTVWTPSYDWATLQLGSGGSSLPAEPTSYADFNETGIDISLPGIWSYLSIVTGGKGFKVNGSEYNYIDTNSTPYTFEQGSTFNQIMDEHGNTHIYMGFFVYQQQFSPRLWKTEYVGGGERELFYDGRGNVEKQVMTSTNGTDTITLESDFDSSCDYPVSCNKPNWTKDAKGSQTDYVYSDTHGGVLKVTSPAVNTVGPQARYEYQQIEARYKNASGQIVASGEPIWMLVKEEFCMTSNASGSGCGAGASDEVVTEYDYGPTNQANNLWLRGVSVTADGQTLRTCYYYDDFGNRIAETQPNAALSSCY